MPNPIFFLYHRPAENLGKYIRDCPQVGFILIRFHWSLKSEDYNCSQSIFSIKYNNYSSSFHQYKQAILLFLKPNIHLKLFSVKSVAILNQNSKKNESHLNVCHLVNWGREYLDISAFLQDVFIYYWAQILCSHQRVEVQWYWNRTHIMNISSLCGWAVYLRRFTGINFSPSLLLISVPKHAGDKAESCMLTSCPELYKVKWCSHGFSLPVRTYSLVSCGNVLHSIY